VSAPGNPGKTGGFYAAAGVGMVPISQAKRRILRDGARANEERDASFRRIVLSIPAGKVSTYGSVAAAAGYPLYHRAVARLLRTDPPDRLPWHRVLGAGGEIKLRGDAAKEQRARLRLEGVKFRGKRVDMQQFEHAIRSWETFE
jgi:methylated-DNA-protein-cysteine methyltransferase-like protein